MIGAGASPATSPQPGVEVKSVAVRAVGLASSKIQIVLWLDGLSRVTGARKPWTLPALPKLIVSWLCPLILMGTPALVFWMYTVSGTALSVFRTNVGVGLPVMVMSDGGLLLNCSTTCLADDASRYSASVHVESRARPSRSSSWSRQLRLGARRDLAGSRCTGRTWRIDRFQKFMVASRGKGFRHVVSPRPALASTRRTRRTSRAAAGERPVGRRAALTFGSHSSHVTGMVVALDARDRTGHRRSVLPRAELVSVRFSSEKMN